MDREKNSEYIGSHFPHLRKKIISLIVKEIFPRTRTWWNCRRRSQNHTHDYGTVRIGRWVIHLTVPCEHGFVKDILEAWAVISVDVRLVCGNDGVSPSHPGDETYDVSAQSTLEFKLLLRKIRRQIVFEARKSLKQCGV